MHCLLCRIRFEDAGTLLNHILRYHRNPDDPMEIEKKSEATPVKRKKRRRRQLFTAKRNKKEKKAPSVAPNASKNLDGGKNCKKHLFNGGINLKPKKKLRDVLPKPPASTKSGCQEDKNVKKTVLKQKKKVCPVTPVRPTQSRTLVNNTINPFVHNCATCNQAVQPSVFAASANTFDFNSRNILKWLAKHKDLCKNMKYPLPLSLFNATKLVHNAIFDRYCTVSVHITHQDNDTLEAVMEVYKELDRMIKNHIYSINNTLSST